MVGTMLPIGYGERLRALIPKSLVGYAIGSVLAAASVGALAGAVGRVVPLPSMLGPLGFGITGAVALLYGCSDASLLHLPRPNPRRQVPSSWYRRFRPGVTGLLYGAALGVGFATRVPVSTFYLLPLWAILSRSIVSSSLLFGAFGAGRVSAAAADPV